MHHAIRQLQVCIDPNGPCVGATWRHKRPPWLVAFWYRDAMTEDSERLMGVVRSLAHAAAVPKRKLPVISNHDAAALTAMMHDQIDAATQQRNIDAKAAGFKIACDAGCNACCALPVLVTEPEVVAVERWLSLPENAAMRERFFSNYGAWSTALGSAIDDVANARNSGDVSDRSREYHRKRVLCPLNVDGLCGVYPVRPALCRTAHALDSNERCKSDTAGSISILAHPGVDQTYQSQNSVRELMHSSLRPNKPNQILAKAVHRRLSSATAAPNQPCPCGSGLKFKHCCRE